MAVTVRYESGGPFQAELKRRVDEYFASRGLPRQGSPWMAVKTAVILSWFVASYVLLVFGVGAWWQALAAAISLGLAMAGIGFSIQHDANHGGYSANKKVNHLLSLTLDLMGGSSYLWRWKHNIFHHTHTNVTGSDPDIDLQPLVRMSQLQPRRGLHRFQHFYVWPLYALLAVKWQFVTDFIALARGAIGGHPIPRPRGWALAELIAGKAVFYGWSLVLPAFFHPLWVVLVFHLVASFAVSVTLAITFQLAHCLEDADFPKLEGSRIPREWAIHEVRTTVDFAPGNKLLTWYLGGLNFQVVHHLFPKVCHLHYPALSRIVEETCQKFGERYRVNPSVAAAIASHARWLRHLGRPEPLSVQPLPG